MRGYTGAIAQLVVNQQQLDLDTDGRLVRKLNVEYSSTCSNALCNNRGMCVRTQNRVGYKCLCEESSSSSSTGANCELSTITHDDEINDDQVTNPCRDGHSNEVCKNGGRCSDRVCQCSLGFSGSDCSKGIHSFEL